MKVLMTADTVGGVWFYALELAQALVPHGVRVALATMGAPLSTAQRAQVALLPNVTIHESSYRLEWMDDPWADVERAGAWLLQLERELAPDVVHLNGYAHGVLPWRAPRLVVGHSCVLTWWEAVKGEPAPRGWDRYRHALARGLASADLVVTPTRAMLAMLEAHYGDLPRASVIPNGRDPAAFAPGEYKEPFVLAAGRLWDEAKNIALLDAVAPRLAWPVYVAGESSHPSGHAIELRGARPLGVLPPGELAGLLGRASVYALPARYEPFGLSALEAGLAGCALVLGDVPTLREVWGRAATFVPPDDGDALAAAIARLIEDPSAREEMGAMARRRALEYAPQRMATTYLAVYRELVARASVRRTIDDRRDLGLVTRADDGRPGARSPRYPS